MKAMKPARIPLILLASQSQQLAYLIQRYAGSCGCRFMLSEYAEAFDHSMLLEQPDVILLDISQGKPESLLALQKLRSTGRAREIPVILCATSELDWLKLEADGRLLQPILFEQFVSAIAETGIIISENKEGGVRER